MKATGHMHTTEETTWMSSPSLLQDKLRTTAQDAIEQEQHLFLVVEHMMCPPLILACLAATAFRCVAEILTRPEVAVSWLHGIVDDGDFKCIIMDPLIKSYKHQGTSNIEWNHPWNSWNQDSWFILKSLSTPPSLLGFPILSYRDHIALVVSQWQETYNCHDTPLRPFLRALCHGGLGHYYQLRNKPRAAVRFLEQAHGDWNGRKVYRVNSQRHGAVSIHPFLGHSYRTFYLFKPEVWLLCRIGPPLESKKIANSILPHLPGPTRTYQFQIGTSHRISPFEINRDAGGQRSSQVGTSCHSSQPQPGSPGVPGKT